MKFKLFIDKDREEEVVVYAHKKTKLTDAIEHLVSDESDIFVGYKGREGYRLSLADIVCFSVENNRVYAITDCDSFCLKSRLYVIEENLPESFVKINQSCVANIGKIAKFDASVSGTLTVVFKNGKTDYVSRRCMKFVKERLGL